MGNQNISKDHEANQIGMPTGLNSKMETQNAQQTINESEGLTFEEQTPLFLSKVARGEMR